MGLTAIDLGFRGAASGVFLLIVLVALQRRAVNQNILLGIAMCAGGVFYAIVDRAVLSQSVLVVDDAVRVLARRRLLVMGACGVR